MPLKTFRLRMPHIIEAFCPSRLQPLCTPTVRCVFIFPLVHITSAAQEKPKSLPTCCQLYAFKDESVKITRVILRLEKEIGGGQMGFVSESSQHPVCVSLQVGARPVRRSARRVMVSLLPPTPLKA